MNKELNHAFQAALEALARGEPLESTLAAHPQFAAEMKPLLQTAIAATQAKLESTPETEASEHSRRRMLQYASSQRMNRVLQIPLWKRWRFSYGSLAAVVIVLLSSVGIWVASAQALPGDTFYSLKLRAEELNLSLTANKVSMQSLQTQYRQRRVDEVQKLLEVGRVEAIAFEGVLRLQGDEIWDVERVLVLLNQDTAFQGPFSLGDDVEVRGVTSNNGSVLASTIGLRRYHLINQILAQDGNIWVIADRRIDVSDALIEPGIVLGSLVEVEVEVTGENLHKALLVKHFEMVSTPTLSESGVEATEAPRDESETDTKVEFNGLLESMNSTVVIVNGRTFHLTTETEIEGVLAPGVNITVEAVESDDGGWIANRIRVLEANDFEPEISSETDESDDNGATVEDEIEGEDEPDDDDDLEDEEPSDDDDDD